MLCSWCAKEMDGEIIPLGKDAYHRFCFEAFNVWFKEVNGRNGRCFDVAKLTPDYYAAMQRRLPDEPNLQTEILQQIWNRLDDAERVAIEGSRFEFLWSADTAGILLVKCPSLADLRDVQQIALAALCELSAHYTGVKQLLLVGGGSQLQVWRDRAGNWIQSQAEVK